MHGVAHHQRRLCRIDDDDGFAFFRTADFFNRTCRGAGEFINVFACARANAARGNRRDDFTVAHRLHARDRCNHRNRRLTAAGDHIHIHFLFADVFGQIHRRHAIRPNRGGREVNHDHAQFIQFARIFRVHIGRGRVERNLYAVTRHIRQQAVYAFGGGVQAHFLGTFQAVRFGINPNHPHRLQHLAAFEFRQQIRADVTRPDQGAFDFAHIISFNLLAKVHCASADISTASNATL